MMNLTLIPVSESDRAFFCFVHHTAYREVIEKMFGWDEKQQDMYANKAFDEGGMNILFLEDKKIGVVGWVEFPDYLWLKELFILPEYQRMGIGSQVVQMSIKKEKKLCKDLRLQTLKENLGAKALYERHGFVVTESTDIHWKLHLTVSK